MTAYQGGKGTLGKNISRIIKFVEDDLHASDSVYVEPFCGMCEELCSTLLRMRPIETLSEMMQTGTLFVCGQKSRTDGIRLGRVPVRSLLT